MGGYFFLAYIHSLCSGFVNVQEWKIIKIKRLVEIPWSVFLKHFYSKGFMLYVVVVFFKKDRTP